VTVELDNDKIHETPTLNNNKNASNNKEILGYLSLYIVFQVFKIITEYRNTSLKNRYTLNFTRPNVINRVFIISDCRSTTCIVRFILASNLSRWLRVFKHCIRMQLASVVNDDRFDLFIRQL